MNVHLLYRDRDWGRNHNPIRLGSEIISDLELSTIFEAMSKGDDFLLEVAKNVVLNSMEDSLETILYRQEILKDCIQNKALVNEMYSIAVDTLQKEKRNYWSIFRRAPDHVLYRSLEVMQMFMLMLKKLRFIADENAGKFDSEGLSTLITHLKNELPDEYFSRVNNYLEDLSFPNGYLLSSKLGEGNKGYNYILRKFKREKRGWLKKLIDEIFSPESESNKRKWLPGFPDKRTTEYTFYISPRDDNGIRAIRNIKDEGINQIANVLAQSNDHILNFFRTLRTELAFYLGCLNLLEKLTKIGEAVTFPRPLPDKSWNMAFNGLYDPCLALTMNKKTTGNDLRFEEKQIVIITGANQGGKSTFMRSVGLSQLMMQCGMFVPAVSFSSTLCDSLFTHFKREEEQSLKSGKLEEELVRMSKIIDQITPRSLLLLNESFSATNEREGSEIAKQILSALLDNGIRICFVTHLFEFAIDFYNKKMNNTLFLQAEREPDGRRLFILREGFPSGTSYGEDIYNKVFQDTEEILQDQIQRNI
jgi:DNA mismatch repair ATPase MutS